MMQTISQAVIEATKAATMAVKDAVNPVNALKCPNQAVLRPNNEQLIGRKQTSTKSYKTKIEIKNIFMTNSYSKQDNEKVPIILHWFGREGLPFLQTLSGEEKNINPAWNCF